MLEWSGERFLPWVYADGARLHYEHLHRYALAADFSKNKQVLDLACGEGYGAFLMSLSAGHVVGVDIDEQTINHAKGRYSKENLEFIKGSITDVPIQGQQLFDIITCFEGLEHISQHDSLISEVKRLLAKDGLFFVSTPNRKVLTDDLGYQNPFHLRELYLEEFKHLLGSYFKHTIFLGQKVYSGSNLWDLEHEEHSHQEYLVEKADKELSLIHSEKQSPWYIVGIASDVDLESRLIGTNNWLIDVSDSLTKYYLGQVSELGNTNLAKDEQLKNLKKEAETLALNIELQNKVNEIKDNSIRERNSQIKILEENIRIKENQLNYLQIQMQRSITLKISTKYQRVVERLLRAGTKRRRYYERGLTGIRIILDEGFRSFFKRVKQRYFGKHSSSEVFPMITSKPNNIELARSIIEVHVPSTKKPASNIIKKVLFLLGDEIRNPDFTSCRYRIDNIVEGLISRGIACYVCYENAADKIGGLPGVDIAIIYRAALSENVKMAIDNLRQQKIPLIFDTDDLIFDPDSAKYIEAWKSWTPSRKYEYTKSILDTLVNCDFATCTTEFLANRIKIMGPKSFVVPNTLNKVQFKIAKQLSGNKTILKNGKIKIGYFNGNKTQEKDFLEAAEALREILSKFENTEFHLVGDLDLPDAFKVLSNKIVRKPFMLCPETLEYLSEMDINIAPLEQNNPFNDGKSELNIFEPALVRVPTIASRTNSYSRCITDGENGFLAGSKEEWVQKLVRLVDNKDLRNRVGNQARNDFVEKFYIENVIDGVIKTYENIKNIYLEDEKKIFRPPYLIGVPKQNIARKESNGATLTIAISIVRNEGDIISAWMSHVLALFDKVYIVDHISNDGTRQFLVELAKTHNNIQVFSFDQPGYFQSENINYLAEIISREYPDSWIFPLDADEFISIKSRTEFLSHIKNIPKDKILKLKWKNCIPTRLTHDSQFEHLSTCLIPSSPSIYHKVAIHSSCFNDKNWRFVQGNHGVKDNSGVVIDENNQIDLADILHVPIRGIDHFTLKCLQGYLAYDALPIRRNHSGQGFHWREMIEKVSKQNILNPDQVREFAALYGQPQLYTSKGLSISDMTHDGWISSPFSVAHIDLDRQIRRHYTYIKLAKEILKPHKNKELESFFRVAREYNTAECNSNFL